MKSGIYAWYYSPEITDYDIKDTITKVQKLRDENNLKVAKDVVKKFLEANIFKYFREAPYNAVIYGSLKPRYEGQLGHETIVSHELINRVVDNPERLKTIKQIIEFSAPDFASPLYIGMSSKLYERLQDHKKLIQHYRSLSSTEISENSSNTDHSFAIEICRRGIQPSRLFVVIKTIEKQDKNYIDIENILNRIHYPLLGRN